MGNPIIPTKITTSQLGASIIKHAEGWLAKTCFEETKNESPCITDLISRYSATAARDNWAYCAIFVSVVLQAAFSEYKATNPIWTSGTLSMLSLAKQKNLKIDKVPKPGAIFQKNGESGVNRHVGLVWAVMGDKILTLEGNAEGHVFTSDKWIYEEGVVTKKEKFLI